MRERVLDTKKDQFLQGSVLPALTNEWLRVNAVNTGVEKESLTTSLTGEQLAHLPKGIHPLLTAQSAAIPSENYALREGDVAVRVVKPAGERVVEHVHITMQPGHHARMILDYEEGEGCREHLVQLGIWLEEDAELELVLIQRLGHDVVHNLSIHSELADGAQLHITQASLGAKIANTYYYCDLQGVDATTTWEGAYVARESQNYDFYMNVEHRGVGSQSDIQLNGALFEQAKKSFRGTIDFKVGAKGAVGNEEEYALLMSPTAKSVAVPLLLAHEDDVQGNHAASAGRVDEEMLFYLMSRGLSRKQAQTLLVEAKMTPMLDRIFDEEVREQVRHALHEKIQGGEA